MPGGDQYGVVVPLRKFLERKQYEVVAFAIFDLAAAEHVVLLPIEQARARSRTEEGLVDAFINQLDSLVGVRLQQLGVPNRSADHHIVRRKLLVQVLQSRVLEYAAAKIWRADDAALVSEAIAQSLDDGHVQPHACRT